MTSKHFGDFSGSKKGYTSCYHGHPILALGGGKFIGGSCLSPAHDADVFIGLDTGMRVKEYKPWERNVTQLLFPVHDMCAPDNAADFKRLVEYVCNQLQNGKTVHAGCIGGHGRTGTLLAAVYSVITGEPDSITKVRSIYCHKAVESSTQAKFLTKHFGITPAKGAKEGKDTFGFALPGTAPASSTPQAWPKSGASEVKKKSTAYSQATQVWTFVNTNRKAVGVLF